MDRSELLGIPQDNNIVNMYINVYITFLKYRSTFGYPMLNEIQFYEKNDCFCIIEYSEIYRGINDNGLQDIYAIIIIRTIKGHENPLNWS